MILFKTLRKGNSAKPEEYVNSNEAPPCSFDDIDEFYDDDETLSVWDAAEIWASHGKDEDYTFGYSEEELEDALND